MAYTAGDPLWESRIAGWREQPVVRSCTRTWVARLVLPASNIWVGSEETLLPVINQINYTGNHGRYEKHLKHSLLERSKVPIQVITI